MSDSTGLRTERQSVSAYRIRQESLQEFLRNLFQDTEIQVERVDDTLVFHLIRELTQQELRQIRRLRQ
ncbi:hypothetical protein QQZ08_010234 [Neonectria magnoliae]|uniref:Uncharacterized protein n=1 Tax=Neonectria magnoliae TaxID=2732573 RepID=A0ABR1HI18_9HYPO